MTSPHPADPYFYFFLGFQQDSRKREQIIFSGFQIDLLVCGNTVLGYIQSEHTFTTKFPIWGPIFSLQLVSINVLKYHNIKYIWVKKLVQQTEKSGSRFFHHNLSVLSSTTAVFCELSFRRTSVFICICTNSGFKFTPVLSCFSSYEWASDTVAFCK